MYFMLYLTLVFFTNISQSFGFKSKRQKLYNLKFVIAYILCSIYVYTYKLHVNNVRLLLTALDEK